MLRECLSGGYDSGIWDRGSLISLIPTKAPPAFFLGPEHGSRLHSYDSSHDFHIHHICHHACLFVIFITCQHWANIEIGIGGEVWG